MCYCCVIVDFIVIGVLLLAKMWRGTQNSPGCCRWPSTSSWTEMKRPWGNCTWMTALQLVKRNKSFIVPNLIITTFSATQILWKIMASHWLNWNFSTAPCSTDSLRKTFPPAYQWRMFGWQGCASQLQKCSWTVQFGKIGRSLRRVASSIFISLTWHWVLMQSFLLPLTYRLKKGVKDKLIYILNLANWVGG